MDETPALAALRVLCGRVGTKFCAHAAHQLQLLAADGIRLDASTTIDVAPPAVREVLRVAAAMLGALPQDGAAAAAAEVPPPQPSSQLTTPAETPSDGAENSLY